MVLTRHMRRKQPVPTPKCAKRKCYQQHKFVSWFLPDNCIVFEIGCFITIRFLQNFGALPDPVLRRLSEFLAFGTWLSVRAVWPNVEHYPVEVLEVTDNFCASSLSSKRVVIPKVRVVRSRASHRPPPKTGTLCVLNYLLSSRLMSTENLQVYDSPICLKSIVFRYHRSITYV